MDLQHQLTPRLKRLRLSGVLETLDVRNQQAIAEQWSYVEFLSRLAEDEVERRDHKQLALRLRRATVNTGKTLESFDFAFNPSINRQQVLDLATSLYVQQKRNVLICGPTGVGKSHLAQALGHEACRRGYDVLFTSAHKMLLHLNGGRAYGTYARRLTSYPICSSSTTFRWASIPATGGFSLITSGSMPSRATRPSSPPRTSSRTWSG